MNGMDYWRLCDELSVVQTALLILGKDPDGIDEHIFNLDAWERPKGFNAVFTALKNAVDSEQIKARIRYSPDEYFPDWQLTVISVTEIQKWLSSRSVRTGFFFSNNNDEERDYLDKKSSFYAPKLAAAVRAWETVTTDQTRLHGKTPKQAMQKWLREHASEYGLTKDDGNPNDTGIEEICKIANWKLEGGAAKTPTPANTNPPPLQLAVKSGKISRIDDLESEIPF